MSSTLILFPLQDFSSRETDFHFCQFLSNFLKYSFLNFSSSHLYNIFAMYFSGNSFLLKSFPSAISNFSYCLTFAFILLSNSATSSFVFSKSSSLSQVLYSTVNLFYCTKYFTTSLIFPLFRIFSTSHFSTPSISTSFTSSTFCLSTCFLYYTTCYESRPLGLDNEVTLYRVYTRELNGELCTE